MIDLGIKKAAYEKGMQDTFEKIINDVGVISIYDAEYEKYRNFISIERINEIREEICH